MAKVKIKCIFCKKDFYVFPCLSNRAKYCSHRCYGYNRGNIYKGDKLTQWKGGRTLDKSGYVLILDRSHPNIDKKGVSRYRREHVAVMERYLKRQLTQKEIVHHVNGNKQDNTLNNLRVMSRSEHTRLHKPRLGTSPNPC